MLPRRQIHLQSGQSGVRVRSPTNFPTNPPTQKSRAMNIKEIRLSTNRAFTLVELLVVIAIIGVLMGLILSAVQAARESSRKMSCQNNLKNIALACLSHETARGALPTGSYVNKVRKRNGLSWLVELLPHLENDSLHSEISRQVYAFRQTDPAKQAPNIYELEQVNEVRVPSYGCPSDDEVVDNRNGEGLAGSSYAGVSGSAASRGDEERTVGDENNLCGAVNFDGVLYPGSRTKLRQIEDGTSNTLLAGERWYQLRAWTAGAYWPPPGGSGSLGNTPVPDSCMSTLKNVDAEIPLNASIASVGYYKGHQDDERPGAAPADQKIVGYNNLPFGSFHPGGANVCMVDGSVHFVEENIAPRVFVAMASRDGTEIEAHLWQ